MAVEDLTWDDVRFFLAVARTGSVRRAADELGVSRPTVMRHVEALEKRVELVLFERVATGLHLTPAGIRLVASAEQTERGVLAFRRAAEGAQDELEGRIEVSLTEFVGAELLMDDLVAFAERWPGVDLRLHSSYELADLERGDAHVVLRVLPLGKTPKGNLVGRKAATIHVAVYGGGRSWLGQDLGLPDLLAQMRRETFPDVPERGFLHGVFLLREACAQGLGYAVLPCYCAEPRLERHSEPRPAWVVWVLSHPDLVRTPRLRIFREAMFEALAKKRPRLEGRIADA